MAQCRGDVVVVPRHVFVTGGMGFIGSGFIRMALQRWPEANVVNFDLLTPAGDRARLTDCEANPRYRFIRGDIRDPNAVLDAMTGCSVVVHLAAHAHSRESLLPSDVVLSTNVLGTHVLVEAARELQVRKFVLVGTCAAYGTVPERPAADETRALDPDDLDAVSKTAADMLVRAYHKTDGFPAVTVRPSHVFGPYQAPDRFIPRTMTNLLEGRQAPLGRHGPRVRDWVHVDDVCDALVRVVEHARGGVVYNVASGCARSDLDVAGAILGMMDLDPTWLSHGRDQAGHGRRYAVDTGRIQAGLEWAPRHPFKHDLYATLRWYRDHRDWWEPIKRGSSDGSVAAAYTGWMPR